jgi:RHS repeat-associated protein
LTYDGFNTFAYDVENRLIQAANSMSGTSQCFYDPLGRRKQKVVGGVTTQFVLAGDEEVADYSGAATAQVLTVRGVAGSPVASVMVSSGAVAYYHHDVLGSTVALTQSGTSGAAEVFTYGEFGLPAGGSGTPYLFAGYRYDAETGLYYVRARYYSPQHGRFLQTDPIGITGGRNLYAYVNNDPINRTDRYGTCGNPQGCGNKGLPPQQMQQLMQQLQQSMQQQQQLQEQQQQQQQMQKQIIQNMVADAGPMDQQQIQQLQQQMQQNMEQQMQQPPQRQQQLQIQQQINEQQQQFNVDSQELKMQIEMLKQMAQNISSA